MLNMETPLCTCGSHMHKLPRTSKRNIVYKRYMVTPTQQELQDEREEGSQLYMGRQCICSWYFLLYFRQLQ